MPELGRVLDFMRAIWGLAQGLEARSRLMERSLGVTGPQRLVIRIVGRSPNISAGLLAETMRIHPSTLTGILQRLAARGLIRREADPHDARKIRLQLTEAGRYLDITTGGTVEEAVQQVLDNLPGSQVETTRKVMRLLTVRLSEPPGARPARPRTRKR